jgi:hypothetical protein
MAAKTHRTAVALAAAAALALPAAALAQTDKERELEARVTELEKIVQQLLAERQAAGAAPAAAVAVPAAPPPATPAPVKAGPPPIQDTSIVPNALAGTKFFVTGFGKLDVLYTDTDDGRMPSGPGRDFYLPGATPVGGAASYQELQAHIKQTRMMIGTDTALDAHKLGTRLEFDLYGSALGNERSTNTYGLQVRHAYITYDKWLFGQTWSNFQDVATLPESVDFIGNTDGQVFVREPQVRFTSGGLSLSAENPETTITPYTGVINAAGASTRITSDENRLPDLTAAYQWQGPWGHLRVAGLGRELRYDTGTASDDGYAFAGQFSGKFLIGRDDLRFTLIGGDAIGRYVALNAADDAVLEADGSLEAISGLAGSIAWRHVFTPQWRTNLMFSYGEYDYGNSLAPSLVGGFSPTESTLSWAINTFYSPVPKLDLGLEYRHAERELENGVDGSMGRLQATAKYSF